MENCHMSSLLPGLTVDLALRNHLLKGGSMRNYTPTLSARVAELADALDSGSSE